MCWAAVTVLAMLLEIMAVIKAMQLSIMGPGLALRGPEGSMTRAVLVMRSEYRKVHRLFYSGLFCFHVSASLYIWTAFPFSVGIVTTVLVVLGLCFLYLDFNDLAKRLRLPSELHGGESWDPIFSSTSAREIGMKNKFSMFHRHAAPHAAGRAPPLAGNYAARPATAASDKPAVGNGGAAAAPPYLSKRGRSDTVGDLFTQAEVQLGKSRGNIHDPLPFHTTTGSWISGRFRRRSGARHLAASARRARSQGVVSADDGGGGGCGDGEGAQAGKERPRGDETPPVRRRRDRLTFEDEVGRSGGNGNSADTCRGGGSSLVLAASPLVAPSGAELGTPGSSKEGAEPTQFSSELAELTPTSEPTPAAASAAPQQNPWGAIERWVAKGSSVIDGLNNLLDGREQPGGLSGGGGAPVVVNCREIGGEGRCFSWRMPLGTLLAEVRETSARALKVDAAAVELHLRDAQARARPPLISSHSFTQPIAARPYLTASPLAGHVLPDRHLGGNSAHVSAHARCQRVRQRRRERPNRTRAPPAEARFAHDDPNGLAEHRPVATRVGSFAAVIAPASNAVS